MKRQSQSQLSSHDLTKVFSIQNYTELPGGRYGNRIFGTGGTISNRGTGSGQYLDYLDRGEVMSAKELISLYPALDEISDIRVESFGTLRSKHVTSEHWKTLAQRLDECLKEPDIVGAVIAHGTGTLEETAWFLHL